MTDTAINAFPNTNTGISKVYAETSAGALVRTDIEKLASSVSGAATGQTFYVDASGNVVKLAIGTTGQVLTVAAGLPSWSTPTASPLEYVATGTASGAAAIDFTTGFSSSYDEYIFVWKGVYPSTSAESLIATVSENGGSSFLTTSVYNTNTTLGSSRWILATSCSNAVADAANGIIRVIITSSTRAAFLASHWLKSSGGAGVTTTSAGDVATSTRANAIRFSPTSGNINGTITMYRVKNS